MKCLHVVLYSEREVFLFMGSLYAIRKRLSMISLRSFKTVSSFIFLEAICVLALCLIVTHCSVVFIGTMSYRYRCAMIRLDMVSYARSLVEKSFYEGKIIVQEDANTMP